LKETAITATKWLRRLKRPLSIESLIRPTNNVTSFTTWKKETDRCFK
jgi:hypothetical protein